MNKKRRPTTHDAAAAIKSLYDSWESGIIVLGPDADHGPDDELNMKKHYQDSTDRALNILAAYIQDQGGSFAEDNIL